MVEWPDSGQPEPLSSWTQALHKLTRETRDRKLVWSKSKVIRTNDTVKGAVYVAEVIGYNVAVYAYEWVDWKTPSSYDRKDAATVGFTVDNAFTTRWPVDASLIYALLHAVHEQVCGTEDFLSQYLKG